MKTRRLAAPLLLIAAASAASGVALTTFQTGCSGQACTIDPFRPDEANATIECPAGLLCYQGQCIRGCNAGQENTISCSGAEDCESSRPNCVLSASGSSFCSACPEGLACVQMLNICRRIDEIPVPETPLRPDMISGPYPLDASFTPMGLRPRIERPDGGTSEFTPLTNVLFIEAAQIVNIMVGPQSVGQVSVRSWDVSQTGVLGNVWRADLTPPQLQDPTLIDELLQPNTCEVRLIVTSSNASTIRPADMGQILIETHPDFTRGGSVPLRADYNMLTNQYEIDAAQPVPTNYLEFSTYSPFEPSYLAITGPGAMNVTNGAWPDFGGAPDFIHHVPFELRPVSETLTLLQGGINVGAAPADLALRFDPFNPAGTSTGRIPGERVALTVRAGRFELYCEVIEATGGDTTLFVPATILQTFRGAVATPGTYPLTFERVNKGRPPIDPDLDAMKAIDLIVHVSHKFRSVMRIQ